MKKVPACSNKLGLHSDIIHMGLNLNSIRDLLKEILNVNFEFNGCTKNRTLKIALKDQINI